MPFSPRQNRDRKPALPLQPIVDPADWTAAELAASDDWIYTLSKGDCDEITGAIAAIEKRGISRISAEPISSCPIWRRSWMSYTMNCSTGGGSC